ncbi:MAG: anaerobic ribonucleoside-triphosphate reductase [Clostridia bacterium]|nr:anaerobic ribonucleoside-triphosphate reductase [Clostridia bacterium]
MTKTTTDKIIGQNVGFDRIRRITGYLVGTTDRWNNAKRAELNDRVKHTDKCTPCAKK